MRFRIRYFSAIVSLLVLSALASGMQYTYATEQPDTIASPHKTGVSVIACRHLFTITGDGRKPFNQPSAVDVFKDRICVLDGVNARVVVFDSKGAYLFQFGQPGSDPGEFKSPLGLTIDYQGRIFVADSGNHRIQVFDPQGRFLSCFPLIKDRYGFQADPTDLVVDQGNDRMVIVDNDNHRILFYTMDGKIIKEVGGVGLQDGEFRYPYSIAMDEKGNYYVVDVLNTRVQVFNPQGVFERNIGEWGIEKGQFFRPQGIAIDRRERVYVTESYEKIGVIQLFSLDGTFLAILGDGSKEKIRFSVPTDLCFDDHGRVYICEMYQSRVSVYQMER